MIFRLIAWIHIQQIAIKMIFYINSTSKWKPYFGDENNNVVDGNAQEYFFTE